MKSYIGAGRRRRLSGVAILAAAAMALSACGASNGAQSQDVKAGPPVDASDSAWKTIVDKANQEGQLTLYWSSGQRNAEPNLFKAWEKQYPKIKVTIVFLATGELVNRVDQEVQANVRSADVVNHASPGWFAKNYDAQNFAALQISPDNKAAGWDSRLGGKSYATWWGFQGLMGYRTAKGTPAPDLKALLDSNPKAKIGLVNPKVAAATAFIYETLRRAYGDEILDQLAKADYTVFDSNSTLSAGLAAGAVDYSYPDNKNTTGPLIAKGAPLAQIVTDKGQAGANYNVAVMKTAPHPNAAQVWANFVMSRAGQEAIVADNEPAATVPTDVQGAIPWSQVKFLDPKVWTTDAWNQWIAKYWTPRFTKK